MSQVTSLIGVAFQFIILLGVVLWFKGFADGSESGAISGQGVFMLGAAGLIGRIVYDRYERMRGTKVMNIALIVFASFLFVFGVLCFSAPSLVNFIPVPEVAQ